jgi:hypothetical protein
MQNDGPMEEADYQAMCQAEAEAEGEAYQEMLSNNALAEAEVQSHNEIVNNKLNDLLKAIDGLDGISIPFNIIKDRIIPLKAWLNEVVNKK